MTDYAPLLAQLHALQSEVVLGRNHVYRDRGEYMVGVTTACGVMDAPQLDRWKVREQVKATARAAYSNPPEPFEPVEAFEARLARIAAEQYEHERIADEAAELGNEIHALIEKRAKDMLGIPCPMPFVSEAAERAISGWAEWAASVGLEPLMAEGRVASRKFRFCGSFDLLARVNGRPSVIDWKSLKPAVYPNQRLQSSAYRGALIEMGWPELDGYIVGIARDGSSRIVMHQLENGPELDRTYDMFRACVRIHGWLRDLERVNRKERVIASAEKFMEKNG